VNSLKAWLYAPASNNLRVIAWVLVMTLLILALWEIGKNLWALRPPVKNFTDWVAKAPTTNLRILNGIALATMFVIMTMIAGLFGIEVSETILLYIGGFILIQEAVDVAQFGWKRSTFKAEAMGMTRESTDPAPPTPAAEIVRQTGEAPVPPAPKPPEPAPLPKPPELPPGTTVSADVPGEGD
jgi:hypothetical protein